MSKNSRGTGGSSQGEEGICKDKKLSHTADQFDINLSDLTLDDLVVQFQEVDRQYHLIKGKILLEARRRFKSDQEFGKWVASHSLCVGTQQTRNRLIHLAEFFDGDRDMAGISLTAAYEISAPVNRKVAPEVYEQAYDNNLSVKAVKDLFSNTKQEVDISAKTEGDKRSTKKTQVQNGEKYEDEVYLMAVKVAEETMKNKTNKYKIDVLKRSIQYLEQL